MKFFRIAAAAALSAATVASTQVACRINGVQDSVVDLETGVCDFIIPSALPVTFSFITIDNYEVDAYYTKVDGAKVFNDIAKAGRTILIPAKALYEFGNFPLYHIHADKKPSANSTQALHARFNKDLTKRDDISNLIAQIESMSGEEVPQALLKVSIPDDPAAPKPVDPAAPKSETETSTQTSTQTPTQTKTNTKTTMITITSCSDNKCSEKTVPATQGPTTVTHDGTTTVYTTWCPVTAAAAETSTTTKAVTTIITVTHCSDNKCSETTVPATQGPTTTTINGRTTIYTTWCPVTAAAAETSTTTSAVTTVITVTHCSDNKCTETTVPATAGPTTVTSAGTTMVYTTLCPVTAAETSSTVATTSTITVTNCSDNKCSETIVPATAGPTTVTSAGTTIVYTTWAAVTESATKSAPTVDTQVTTHPTTPITVAVQSTTQSQPPSVKLGNAGYKVGASLVMLALPFAYIF